MNIQRISSSQNFGQVVINNPEYEKILAVHRQELNKITDGYDVYISEEPPIYFHDSYLDESLSLCGLPSVTINPYNGANRTVPEKKLVVHPGAGEMQSDEGKAQEMIRLIKKAMSFYN